MKNKWTFKYLCVFLSFLFIGVSGKAQNLPDQLVKGFREGNVALLKIYLADPVELSIMGQRQSLSREKGAVQLQLFLTQNVPVSFLTLHYTLKNTKGFSINRLGTKNGEYRVHIVFNTQTPPIMVEQLRIETFKE